MACVEVRESTPETRDPSGGTTGRVKPYGRLGWMGARAEYSHGEDFRSHMYWSPRARRTFKTAGKFFNVSGRNFRDEKLLRGRTSGVDHGRFFRRHGRTRRAQGPGRRDIL